MRFEILFQVTDGTVRNNLLQSFVKNNARYKSIAHDKKKVPRKFNSLVGFLKLGSVSSLSTQNIMQKGRLRH